VSRNNTSEKGIKDNYYGIPLDDIFSPEELSDLKKERYRVTEKRVKRTKEKQCKKKLEFHLDRKICYIICGVIIFVILTMLANNPVTAFVAPRQYVLSAAEETVSKMLDSFDRVTEGIFGFNIPGFKSMTADLSATVTSDSSGELSDVSVKSILGISKKRKEATLSSVYFKAGERVLTSSAYLNDNEIGVNYAELFGEYLTAPAQSFGEKWNGSGLKKVLYADEIDNECEMSFTNLFLCEKFLSDEGSKKLEKKADKLFSSAKAKYVGKDNAYVNGRNVRARKFKFSFEPTELKDNIIDLCEIILNDSRKTKCFPGTLHSSIFELVENINSRITDSVDFGQEVVVYFSVYDGVIVEAETKVQYTENLHNAALSFELLFENTKTLTDALKIKYSVDRENDKYSYSLVSSGNHSMKKDLFSDKINIDIVDNGYIKSVSSDLKLDFKNGQAIVAFQENDGDDMTSAEISGTCSKGRGARLKLDSIKVLSAKNGEYREIAANADVAVTPDMSAEKLNVSGKKPILDLDKSEAESYLRKIEDTDNFRSVCHKLPFMFDR